MKSDLKRGDVIIEAVTPQVDCGRHRAKAVVGDDVAVEADLYRDGPALLRAVIRYRGESDAKWHETPMEHLGNDRYGGSFRPSEMGRYRYTVESWTDRYATWAGNLTKRVDAGQDVDLELEEGALMVEARVKAVPAGDRAFMKESVAAMRRKIDSEEGAEGNDPRVVAALDDRLIELMTVYGDRKGSTNHKPFLELFVDRARARFGAWYELFPRSTGRRGKHGTFRSAAEHLPYVTDLGFDIVYLPPIHPIGETHRKGKNNSLVAKPGDVGSPWAIGSSEGGHKAVHPDLGTIEDFDHFVSEAEKLGLEVCLDFAIQCSPDHPWVKEHPEWFHHRPDGSIKYAENPPKKYQDIYPINFETEDKEALWTEMRSVLEHWISHGVKVFRVDNPHTKSFPFWEWAIGELKAQHPELIFLSEAFTKPKVMKGLAKLGFTQSYTYFTWRNAKWELQEYLTELSQTEVANYFRPNFFVNTPDILHEFLQVGGPPAFKMRLVLASMLSPSYGVYSGYEIFENTPQRKGSEEYLHSEKFEIKQRDLSPDAGLAPYIRRINEIRRKHPALARLTNLTFHHIDKDNLIAFSKSDHGSGSILVVVNLNPFHWEEGMLYFDREALGTDLYAPIEAHDLITGESYEWFGNEAYIRLDPSEPAHIFEVR